MRRFKRFVRRHLGRRRRSQGAGADDMPIGPRNAASSPPASERIGGVGDDVVSLETTTGMSTAAVVTRRRSGPVEIPNGNDALHRRNSVPLQARGPRFVSIEVRRGLALAQLTSSGLRSRSPV